MSTLSRGLAALVLICLPGCVISLTPPDQHASYPATIAPTAAPLAAPVASKQEVELPWRTDVDDVLELADRVVVPGFFMVMQTEDSASARVAGGSTLGGGQSSGARASMQLRVQLNANAMTALADAAYADFIAQLKSTGREVISAEAMRAVPGYSGLDFVDTDEHGFYIQTASMGANKGAVVVPATGQPLWWTNGQVLFGHQVGPIFDQNNHKALQWVSKSNEAVIIYPVFHVNFLDMESSGNSMNYLGGGTAEVSANQNLTVSVSYNVFDGKSLMGGSVLGSASMGSDLGEIVRDSESSGSGVASGIAGLYSAATSSSDCTLHLDWPGVQTKILAGVQGLNAGFMDLVNEYAP